jgi:inner membrane protein
MDNITHTLTGWMMARAGLGQSAERGSALMMMLAANVPDIDVVAAGFPGSLRYLEVHRGYTHCLAMAPVMALVPLLLARWMAKSSINWQSYFACLLGVLSHLALDLTNVYGVRLLLPFSSRWLRLDITDIIDPWILLIFGLALAAPALVALVSSEIGGGKAPGPKEIAPKRGWAWFAILAVLCYEGFRLAAHQRALAVMGAHLYGSASAARISAMPGGMNPLRWRGIVETGDSVLAVPVVLTEEYNPALGHIDYPAQNSAAVNAAGATEPFRAFERFNQLPFWKTTAVGDNIRVELIDLRFGNPRQPGLFVATATLAPDNRVLESHFGFSFSR